MKRQISKWFGHIKQMEESKMTRRVYVSEIEKGHVRGWPPVNGEIGCRSTLGRGGKDP